MRTPAGRIALVVGTVAVLVVLFLVLRRSDETEPVTQPTQVTTTATVETTTNVEQTTTITTAPTTTVQNPPGPRRVRVNVRNGRVQGGVRTVTLKKGDRIVLVVRADVSDHVHVHGYDRFADVGPGRPAQIGLRVTIAGRFEVELEDRHFLIAQLEVRP